MLVSPINPFESEQPFAFDLSTNSPRAIRIQVMWEKMRQEVIDHFPLPKKQRLSIDEQVEKITELYTQDAYHSLSIEGYQVTEELIEKVRTAKWNPNHSLNDREQHNALAARGYFEAFLVVKESVKKILMCLTHNWE